MKKYILSALVAAVFAGNAYANDVSDTLLKKLDAMYPDYNVTILRKSPVPELKDFYEVSIGGLIHVVHQDGKHAVKGSIVEMGTNRNLTDIYRLKVQTLNARKVIPQLSESTFVTFSPEKEKIGTAYVFTDTTCGYCKKLHFEMAKYMEKGIEVKYIPYPRGGAIEGSLGYEQAKQFMCASDTKLALDAMKKGYAGYTYLKESYPEACVSEVFNGLRAGHEIGLSGTPFIYLSNGIALPGYQDVDVIENLLKK